MKTIISSGPSSGTETPRAQSTGSRTPSGRVSMGTGRCITINFTAVDNKYPNTDEEQGGKVFKRYNLLSKEETGQRHPEYRDGKTVYGHFSHRVIFKQQRSKG